jgi:hypothetical protein
MVERRRHNPSPGERMQTGRAAPRLIAVGTQTIYSSLTKATSLLAALDHLDSASTRASPPTVPVT